MYNFSFNKGEKQCFSLPGYMAHVHLSRGCGFTTQSPLRRVLSCVAARAAWHAFSFSLKNVAVLGGTRRKRENLLALGKKEEEKSRAGKK